MQHLMIRNIQPIVLSSDYSLPNSLILTPYTPLQFSAREANFLELRGNGYELRFIRERSDPRPLIIIDPGLTVKITGTRSRLPAAV